MSGKGKWEFFRNPTGADDQKTFHELTPAAIADARARFEQISVANQAILKDRTEGYETQRDMTEGQTIFAQINGRMDDPTPNQPGDQILWRCGPQPLAAGSVENKGSEYFEALCVEADTQGTCTRWKVDPDVDDPTVLSRTLSASAFVLFVDPMQPRSSSRLRNVTKAPRSRRNASVKSVLLS